MVNKLLTDFYLLTPTCLPLPSFPFCFRRPTAGNRPAMAGRMMAAPPGHLPGVLPVLPHAYGLVTGQPHQYFPHPPFTHNLQVRRQNSFEKWKGVGSHKRSRNFLMEKYFFRILLFPQKTSLYFYAAIRVWCWWLNNLHNTID